MNDQQQPDFSLSLQWRGGQRFHGTSVGKSILIDGTREEGPSPVQTLAFSLGSCMGIDVVDVIEKGRFALKAVTCEMKVFRAPETPRRMTGVELHFAVRGDVPEDRVARAIALSHDKYCSVWHSLNPSIDFKTSFAVTP